MSRGRLGEFAIPWAGNTHSLAARTFSTEGRNLALQNDPLSELFVTLLFTINKFTKGTRQTAA